MHSDAAHSCCPNTAAHSAVFSPCCLLCASLTFSFSDNVELSGKNCAVPGASAQADWDSSLTAEIVAHSATVLGGFIFEWADEYWKSEGTQDFCQTPSSFADVADNTASMFNNGAYAQGGSAGCSHKALQQPSHARAASQTAEDVRSSTGPMGGNSHELRRGGRLSQNRLNGGDWHGRAA